MPTLPNPSWVKPSKITMLKIVKKLSQLNFAELMRVYSPNSLQAEQDFYDYLRRDFFRQEGVFYAVWEEDGVYISALRLEPFRDGLLLEGLETRPERRRQGYAKNLLSQVLNETKKPVYSHIHKKNAASQAVHMVCGFVKIQNCAVYIDSSADSRCDTWRFR